MAKFDQTLALTQGTNRVIEDPVPVSGVKAAFEFATEAVAGFANLREDAQNTKRAKKAEEEKAKVAQIQYDVSGVNDAAVQNTVTQNSATLAAREALNQPAIDMTPGTFNAGNISVDDKGVFSSEMPSVSPAVASEINKVAVRSMSIVQAVEQGRMPQISLNASINAEFRRLRDKYPSNVGDILKAFKDNGLDANLSTEAKDAADEHEFEREQGQASRNAEREREEGYIAAASTAIGAIAQGMSREELIVKGMDYEKLDYDLTQAGKRYDNQVKAQGLTDRDVADAQTGLNDTIFSTMKTSIYDDAQPFVRELTQLADSVGKNPNDVEALQRFTALGVKANQLVGQWVEKSVAVAISKGYKGDTEKLRKELTASWGPTLDLFQGDHSLVKAQTDALSIMSTNLKLSTAQALPVYTGLKAAGFKPEEIPAVVTAIQNNPKLATALQKEVSGYVTEFGAERASTHILNMARILRGELSLNQMAPEEAGKLIPTLVTATNGLATAYIRNPKAVDGDKVLNGIGEVVVSLRSVGPSNSPSLYWMASTAFASPTNRKALLNTLKDGNVDETMARATIQASRAGSAQLLDYFGANMRDVNKGSPYVKVKWDDRTASYVEDRSALAPAIAKARRLNNNFGDPGSVSALSNIKTPDSVRRFIAGANMNLDNAIEMGRQDATTPKATDLELRRWYGQNKPLPMEKQAKIIDPSKELDKALTAADKSFTQALDSVSSPREKGASPAIKDSEGFRTHGPVVVEAAKANGVPEQIALALVGKESTFNPSAAGPVIKSGTHAGDRAMGLGQVMAKTAAAFGVTDRASLNPSQQADLAMKVLAANYKQTGNWKDAVSMYFTGTTYDKAKAQGRSDGFNTVMQYVEDIL